MIGINFFAFFLVLLCVGCDEQSSNPEELEYYEEIFSNSNDGTSYSFSSHQDASIKNANTVSGSKSSLGTSNSSSSHQDASPNNANTVSNSNSNHEASHSSSSHQDTAPNNANTVSNSNSSDGTPHSSSSHQGRSPNNANTVSNSNSSEGTSNSSSSNQDASPKRNKSECDFDSTPKVKDAVDSFRHYLGEACSLSPTFRSITSRTVTLSTSLSAYREVMLQYAGKLNLIDPECDTDKIISKAYANIPSIYPASSLFYSYLTAIGYILAEKGVLTCENAEEYACAFVDRINESYLSISCFHDEYAFIQAYTRGFFNFVLRHTINGNDLMKAAGLFNSHYHCRNS